MKLALHIISGAGYGRPFDWETADNISPGHTLPFSHSLRVLVNNLILLFVFPRWILNLPIKKLPETKLVYNEFRRYLQDLIDAERNHQSIAGLDSVLKALVDHSADGTTATTKDRRVLTNEELIGNAFVILLGGHESTQVIRQYASNW
jgi:cytochrome P450